MTPPDDRQGSYGVPYPGTGHDAFGTPGAGQGQSYGRPQYGEYGDPYGRPLPQHGRPNQPVAPPPAQVPPAPAAPQAAEEADSGPLIRPFAMTGGRTRPRYELALEALVSANVDQARLATLLPEHQRICTLCATEVKSVAEVSALLSLPLGVARILVADLAEAGLVAIHQPAAGGESGNQPDVTLLERVLSGLRKL
ncbi:DUF742 domain-containing protein [Kitasatospora kifunensis]|uniref:DUF742 domain-containing protein n=1 Tax=Kitasatospora kifunensis TaxID=58351 RepID=A0A7W7R197_KITKI|nr:DUF742 domain-containing protein [Kitasatospora kifunensis]MBB4923404.1 hypothetical protein [Kitasatospora kifunensis]